ncbi:MAG TPA: flagella assembly protein FlgT middle domain-containing protein [Thermoanaerobaculia bacterium]|nr:flagella assembly protein FlgT middle domain-containing protein [Thermoanaerobaculia bacterium]
MRWKLWKPWTLAALAVLSALPAAASSVEVQLKLPQRARLDLKGRKSIALAPFQVETKEQAERFQGRDIDVQKEFERYLVKVLRRETELKVIETGGVDFPTTDFDQLAKQTDFWQALGERTGADLILAGGLDFDVQDRTGYRTEEYVSPFNGQTYYRQVLVEQTGFEYDILMQVYDAKTGALVYHDNFKDFQKFEGESTDPLRGMFENLLSLEDKIVGVFTQKEVETTRTLFTE